MKKSSRISNQCWKSAKKAPYKVLGWTWISSKLSAWVRFWFFIRHPPNMILVSPHILTNFIRLLQMTTVILINVTSRFWVFREHVLIHWFALLRCGNAAPKKYQDFHFWDVKMKHIKSFKTFTFEVLIKCQRRHWVPPPWQDQWYSTSWLQAWKKIKLLFCGMSDCQ